MGNIYRIIISVCIAIMAVIPAIAQDTTVAPPKIRMRDATTPPKLALIKCHNFYNHNGFLKGEYIFSDNENRKLSVSFVAKDTLFIYNESKTIRYTGFSIDAAYRVHFKDNNTIIVDSVLFAARNDTTFHFSNKEHLAHCKKKVAPPGSDASSITCADAAFYLLEPGDEIKCLNYYERLQIKDFQFILKDMLVEDYFKLFDWKDVIPVRENDSNEFYHQTKKNLMM